MRDAVECMSGAGQARPVKRHPELAGSVSADVCDAMTMKIWLDDRIERDPPVDEGWTIVRSPEETIALLETGEVTELSLDHDLALWDDAGRERTGDDVVTWILEAVVTTGFVPPESIVVHSGNPAGRRRMELGIEAIYRHARTQNDASTQEQDPVRDRQPDEDA